jgi:hypothetical protein
MKSPDQTETPDAGDRERTYHVVIGTPDLDNCPICRAHAQRGKAEPATDESSVPILVQELSLNEILRCPCPMCEQARSEE